MLVFLLNLTRRKAKSQTSTGTLSFTLFSTLFLSFLEFVCDNLRFCCSNRKQQQIDRDFSPCGTPTGLDSRELYDHLQLGSRMFYNSHQDLLWRRKLEEQQADLQTLDLQSRRLLNLQLLDVKKNQLPHHHHHHRALSTGSPIPSPTHSPNPFTQNLIFPTIRSTSSSSTSDILRGEIRNPSPLMNLISTCVKLNSKIPTFVCFACREWHYTCADATACFDLAVVID